MIYFHTNFILTPRLFFGYVYLIKQSEIIRLVKMLFYNLQKYSRNI